MENTLIIAALTIGLSSSIHCLGMCGPIALSLGIGKKITVGGVSENLAYQFGRITTYAILGALAGTIGEGFSLAGAQSWLTIGSGILLIIMGVFSIKGSNWANNIPGFGSFLLKIQNRLAHILRKKGISSRYFTGILNGFLPCGMVYVALAASLAAGGMVQGALFMALFGIGTMPAMFSAVLFGQAISPLTRKKLLKIIPVILCTLGVLFVLRGMHLNIPYISPPEASLETNTTAPHCH